MLSPRTPSPIGRFLLDQKRKRADVGSRDRKPKTPECLLARSLKWTDALALGLPSAELPLRY